MTKEQKFYNALRDVFIGAKIEGEGGFINLMRIKSDYYRKIEKILQKDIQNKLKSHSKFKDELFDKLYSFFNRYFTESGSIYFNSTPFHNNIYEKVYTDNKDVILFWKTQMLYYVKTDKIFNSLPVEFDGLNFYFDASTLENKRANEKRSIVYELKKIKGDKTVIFKVLYSGNGRKTKEDEILKALKKKGISITQEQLGRAFMIFQKQSEVDYFINKNAKDFLREQFKLWLYQYTFDGDNVWAKERIDKLQILKDIAYKIIDFVSQFEDELVRVWNKPKFVRKSNYILSLKTLKKLVSDKEYTQIRKAVYGNIFRNPDYKNDIIETVREIYKQPLQKVYVSKVTIENNLIKLKYAKVFDNKNDRSTYLKKNKSEKSIDSDLFDRKKKIEGYLASYFSRSLTKNVDLEKVYIDTRYFNSHFKNKVINYISSKNNLDETIDGYLIKSDNYQVLKSINKFKNKVKLIYIDLPFNTEGSSYAYLDKFKDSTWLSMLKDRAELAKSFLVSNGSFYIHLDHNCNFLARSLLDSIFLKEPNKEIIWNTGEALSGFKTQALNWIRQHDTILYYSKEVPLFNKMWVKNDEKKVDELGWLDIFKENNGDLFVYKYKDNQQKLSKISIDKVDTKAIGDIWNDVLSLMYTQNMTRENWGEDNTQKPENLLRRIIQSSTKEREFVFDFYLGSGTTAAAAHKLNRKWIGVEMGEYIESIVLKRMKTVVFGDIRPKLSEDLNWQGGGFFKYYELEQYEDALRNCKYEDGDLFNKPGRSPYQEYVFMRDKKMLSILENDYKKNKVEVNLEKLYQDIDIAETLSNLTGKRIKRISINEVEFEDGTKVNTKDLDYKLIKPLIWW